MPRSAVSLLAPAVSMSLLVGTDVTSEPVGSLVAPGV